MMMLEGKEEESVNRILSFISFFSFFFSLATELAIEYNDIFATTNTGDGEFIITGLKGDLYRFF